VQLVGIGLLREQRSAVVVLERESDRLAVVLKVEYEAVMLLRVRAVKPRQRLHRLDARERLVHIHRMQQGLVVEPVWNMSAQIRKRYGSFWIFWAISLLEKPLSDASLTLAPPYSCCPENATIA